MKFPIIDGHNDTLLNLQVREQGKSRSFFRETSVGHIDLPRARRGSFSGGFFAIFTPSMEDIEKPKQYQTDDGYRLPLSNSCSYERSHRMTNAMIADLFRIEAQSRGEFKVVRTVDELKSSMGKNIIAAILHIEGAEAIDTDLHALSVYYQAGLRSLGIVWSRPNSFGEGVPYRFPSSPDTGPGLTDVGKSLVRECNRLGIMLDLSHLNEKGFWDVAHLSKSPLVATHSNAHALCPISRNLTNQQLDEIGKSNGLVGVTYSLNMLRHDGKADLNTPINDIVRHISYIANRIGVEHVALGSDFDGAMVPNAIKDVTGVPKIIQLLSQIGYSEEDLRKITYQNWIRVLQDTWK